MKVTALQNRVTVNGVDLTVFGVKLTVNGVDPKVKPFKPPNFRVDLRVIQNDIKAFFYKVNVSQNRTNAFRRMTGGF